MDERGLGDVGTVHPSGQESLPQEPSGGTAAWSTGGTTGMDKEKVREQASAVAGATSDEARQVAGTAAEGARDVARQTGRQVNEVAGEAAHQARQLLAQTTDQLKEQASAQTGRAAEGLRTVTSQLQALSNGRPEEAGAVGDYARQVTTKLDELAGRLDDGGLDGILDDFQRFARRRPGVFLLGAATAGFFAGRFLRGTQAAQGPDRAEPAAPRWQPDDVGALPLERDVVVAAPPKTVDLTADAPLGTDGGRAAGAL